jgi:putative transposase
MSKRRSKGKILADIGDVNAWPSINDALLDEEKREVFLNRKEAIRLYSEGFSGDHIFSTTRIPSAEILRLLDRCMEISPDGSIWGMRALVPGRRIKIYKRTAPSRGKMPEGRGGCAGALGQLFSEYPDLEKYLVGQVLKKKSSGKIHEFRIRPKDLHASFIAQIKKLGVLPDQWPFNTKYLGLRSITRFMEMVLESNFSTAVAVRGSSAAQAHMSLGSGLETLLRMDDPFDCVEIDAYHIDAQFCISIKNMDGTLSKLNLKRLWLIVIVDRASTAILWFRVVYRSECSASDVVSLISESLSKRLPVPAFELPGLEEPKEQGFPSQRFSQCNQAVWGVVMLDNALAHLAKAVSVHARKQLGFAINYGPVSHFERRPNVEGLFRLIRNDLFGRFPSTTGGGPDDARVANAEEMAVKLNINAEALDRTFILTRLGITYLQLRD